ncbi:MAG: hypothetical protein K5838_00455 [Elusimicrobiales bacterium]|nr:hypothetical protein [Elusimicrobiales bacterium]
MKARFKEYINFSGLRRSGQILIPSLLVIPSLLIFVYLLFETTKLSREKIRQQFAIDSAVFIQMGDYTNLFNRTAYVNGAFPYRIFKEQYGCGEDYNYSEETADTGQKKCMYELLIESGAIPNYTKDTEFNTNSPRTPTEIPWDIRYSRNDNSNNPVEGSNENIPELWIINKDQAVNYYLGWDFLISVYQFYAEVYTLLGSVEAAQIEVFNRITDKSTFLRKSYYLNAGTQECQRSPNSCAEQAVRYFSSAKVTANIRRLIAIGFYGKIRTSGLSPYYIGKTNPPMTMEGEGLFQTAGFSTSVLNSIGNGIDVYQGWDAPPNYFNKDFNRLSACKETGKPCVHSKIASQCPGGSNNKNNCVWPYPTPKYQTRLYP